MNKKERYFNVTEKDFVKVVTCEDSENGSYYLKAYVCEEIPTIYEVLWHFIGEPDCAWDADDNEIVEAVKKLL